MPKPKKAATPRTKKPKTAAPKRREGLSEATVKAIIRQVMQELRRQTPPGTDGLERLIRALKLPAPKSKARKAG